MVYHLNNDWLLQFWLDQRVEQALIVWTSSCWRLSNIYELVLLALPLHHSETCCWFSSTRLHYWWEVMTGSSKRRLKVRLCLGQVNPFGSGIITDRQKTDTGPGGPPPWSKETEIPWNVESTRHRLWRGRNFSSSVLFPFSSQGSDLNQLWKVLKLGLLS